MENTYSLSELCSAKAAQAWCAESTANSVMDSNLALEFGKILEEPVVLLKEMIDTVIWMSGSSDFSPEGQAWEGWVEAREKLSEAFEYVNSVETLLN